MHKNAFPHDTGRGSCKPAQRLFLELLGQFVSFRAVRHSTGKGGKS